MGSGAIFNSVFTFSDMVRKSCNISVGVCGNRPIGGGGAAVVAAEATQSLSCVSHAGQKIKHVSLSVAGGEKG